MDNHTYSPTLLQKIVEAGAKLHSFADAAYALNLFGVEISSRHVGRLTQEIGQELASERDRKVIARRQRQLPRRVEDIPDTVVVEVDGGRVKTRQPECGPGVHHPQFKEEKVATLATLDSPRFALDPCPEPPASFEEARRIVRLVKKIKGFSKSSEVQEQEEVAEEEKPESFAAEESWSPTKKVRSCVASMVCSTRFGPMMASEAQERGFYQAERRAFVADGAAYNWSIHKGYFADYEPVTDFLHVICYLYCAAWGVSEDEDRHWSQYLAWMRFCWQGRVTEVLSQLCQIQAGLDRIEEGEDLEWDDPRKLVGEAVSYLENNQSRMCYPRYRREGLPTTSSLVESLVGEFNARVKGKEKFWNRPEGIEPVLQVRAAILSEDDRLTRHFESRPGCVRRSHRRKAAA